MSDTKKARAEEQFAKAKKAAQESEKNRAQHDAESRAIDEKTARLRGLRLAKEAADASEKAAAPKKKTAPARKTAARKTAPSSGR